MRAVECSLAVLFIKLVAITNALNTSPASNNEPPKIIEGPINATVFFGSEVTLKCRASEGSTIIWERNGMMFHPYFHYGFKIFPSGDLKIDNVYESGIYSCMAKNQYGEVKESARLDVKRKTSMFVEETRLHKIRVGKTANLSCRVQHDDSLSVEIEWLKDGKAIDYDEQHRYSKSAVDRYRHNLSIINTILSDSGEYTCVARTDIDEARAVQTLVVRDVANAPIIENVICDGLSAEIIWKSQGDNNSPVISYYVQYNTSFAPDEWELGEDRIRSTYLKYVMKPGNSYSFQVLAQNTMGISAASGHSKTCTTPPDVPHKNPDNVKTEASDPSLLVISWDPMPEIDHGGSKLHYRVFWKRDIPESQWESKEILDWKENKVVVDGQPMFVKYLIKVVAINEMGESKIPAEEVIGYSGEDQPLLAPENFKVVDLISEKSALLKWDHVSPESLRGHFKGYKLQTWTAEEGEESLREVHLHNDTNEVSFDSLKPYSKNFVRLCAYNSRFDGPSTVITIDTPEGTPSPIQNLKVYVLGPSDILLAWDKPLEPNGKLTGYRVYFELMGRNGYLDKLESRRYFDSSEVTSEKLTNLWPDTIYRFTVTAKTAKGEGKEYIIEGKTHRPDRVSHEPSEPNFKLEPLTSIKTTWQPINGQPTGTHFFTQYRVKGQTNWIDTEEQINGDALIVAGLNRGTIYEFRVVSVDGQFKKESKIQEIKTT